MSVLCVGDAPFLLLVIAKYIDIIYSRYLGNNCTRKFFSVLSIIGGGCMKTLKPTQISKATQLT